MLSFPSNLLPSPLSLSVSPNRLTVGDVGSIRELRQRSLDYFAIKIRYKATFFSTENADKTVLRFIAVSGGG